jgi:hypothetical protein
MSAPKKEYLIPRGSDWSRTFQLAQNPQRIVSSTNASPIVLNVPQHGYSTGQKVRVVNHLTNRGANGNWTITKIDGDHFSLDSSEGSGTGLADGHVAAAIDGTGGTIRCQIREFDNSTSTLLFTPTFAWVQQNILRFKLSLTDTQTKAITVDTMHADIWFEDSNGIDSQRMKIKFDIGKSITLKT